MIDLDAHFPVTDDVTTLVDTLIRLRALKQELGARESEIESILADALPGGGMHFDGVGLVEAKRGAARRTWDGRRLAHILAARTADTAYDRETGEAKPMGAVCAEVADEIIACAALDTKSQNWRSGELKKRVLDPYAYCETEGSRTSIVIHGGAA